MCAVLTWLVRFYQLEVARLQMPTAALITLLYKTVPINLEDPWLRSSLQNSVYSFSSSTEPEAETFKHLHCEMMAIFLPAKKNSFTELELTKRYQLQIKRTGFTRRAPSVCYNQRRSHIRSKSTVVISVHLQHCMDRARLQQQ